MGTRHTLRRINYIIMLIGILVLIAGYILLSGGGPTTPPNLAKLITIQDACM